MNQQEDKLEALLHQWRDIEPPVNFQAQVWRRIHRTVAPAETDFIPWLMRQWLPQPALAAGIAAAMAVVVGVWGGLSTASRPAHHGVAEIGFLGSGTLAGGYLRAASGGER